MIKSISKEAFFSIESLKLSWERYIRVGQAEVKDHVGIDSFEWKLEENIKRLHEKIVENKFQPSEAFKFKVPKPNKMQRTLTLLQVEDALVYQAFANNIATDAFNELKKTGSNSFGFAINDQVALGLDIFKEENPDYYFFKKYPDQYLKFSEKIKGNKLKYKLETDFTDFYDLISHEFLVQYLNEKFISSDEILALFKSCLKEWVGKKNRYNTSTGIPQTEVASPFFANLVLHELDLVMIEKGDPYCRYLDDIFVFSDDEDELRKILSVIDTFAIERGMSLNPQKTTVEKFSSVDLLEMAPSGLEEFADPLFDDIFVEDAEQELGIEYEEGMGFYIMDSEYGRSLDMDEKDEMIYEVFAGNCADEIIESYYLIDQLHSEKDELSKNQLSEIGIACYRMKKFFEAMDHYSGGNTIMIDDAIDFKMFLELLSKYFWKCKGICDVLSCYSRNNDLRKGMLEILHKFKNYEWVVYHVAKALYEHQKLENAEIDDLLLLTRQTDSWFSKSFLYPLMLKNCESDSRQLKSVKNNLFKEENQQVLKNVIFNKYIGSNRFFTNDEIKEIIRRN